MRRRKQRGLTLIELIVAFTIMLILTSMAVPLARNKVRAERERDLRYAQREVRLAIDKFKDNCDMGYLGPQKLGANCYPETLEQLVEGVKLPGPEGIVGSLSGGNQQKVLLARWLEIHPRVLILDEPTRGVDVGAKSEIYRIIHLLADQGVAILVISSELPEVIGVCDRVAVMHEGSIVGELAGDRLTQENIMSLATNVAHPAEALA